MQLRVYFNVDFPIERLKNNLEGVPIAEIKPDRSKDIYRTWPSEGLDGAEGFPF